MTRLLIVSNRLPVKIIKKGNKLSFKRSVGGLATGLGSFYEKYPSLWIGWPGVALEKIKEVKKKVEKRLKSENCYPVFLSQKEIKNYYYGFCNKTIWPLFQYFPQYIVYKRDLWKAYKKVNEIFCKAVVSKAKTNDIIWIHDYQLMLLPQLIREKIPQANIGFFLHIPFPSFEIFRLLPWRKEIIRGLLGADLIGFHTYDYVRHFLNSVHSLFGYEHTLGQITTDERVIKTDLFPMGIDYQKFAQAGQNSQVKKEVKKIQKETAPYQIILSVDRLDYTKGILKRLEVFDFFLEQNPDYKEKVIFILITVPSRTKVEQYKNLKKKVDELVGRINGKYGSINWMPIWYLYKSLPFYKLTAFYQIADVALITPLRDGMNLIAKEFIATKSDNRGVLVLSEMAGAAKELGEAIIVNPNNKERVASALKQALEMPESQQKETNRVMQERLKRYTVNRWAKDFLENLSLVKKIQKKLAARKLSKKTERKLINRYLRAKKRLILLDYDGTLIPFSISPQKAKPTNNILKLIKSLEKNSKNEVVIISGRNKDVLEEYFGHLNIGLVAEHGVWAKEKNKNWRIIESLENEWKKEIKPILEFYVERTPGSFIEEKDFSLVWHYRKTDFKLASLRVKELKEDLRHLIANLNLGFLEGNRVVEIKTAGVNKGKAIISWLSKTKWDFILAIGDDQTDEDIFTSLPKSAYTIKVGFSPSQARFNLKSYVEVRKLLRKMK